MGAGKEAIFGLNCPDGPPELRVNYDFAFREVNRIAGELADSLPMLCEEWRKIHGRY